MDLPSYASTHLSRSPLVLVAAQINFEEVGRDVSHQQARTFQRCLSDPWTRLQAAPQIRTTLTTEGVINEPKRQAYRLQSSDENWSLVLNPDSVILETRSYLGWEDLSAKMDAIAAALTEVLDPAQLLRLGLRYIDQVPLPEGRQTWEGLIPTSLLSISLDPRFGPAVLGSDQRHLLQVDENVKCMLRHGLLADELGRPGGVYLLDFDVFDDAPHAFQTSDLISTATALHNYAGSLFMLSITSNLYELLKG